MNLSAEHLSMSYGKKQALKDFTFTFKPGVYGLLGPNGAGKSTLIKLLTTYLSPTAGRILLDGEAADKLGSRYRRQIGFMPQYQALYENFTLARYLGYIGALKDIPLKQMDGEICRAVEAVNLTEHLDEKLKSFSGGMRQRAMLAQALLRNPGILILDEPSAGLDPKERNRLRTLIARLSEGKIVLIATHIVSDVELISNQIVMLDRGAICCSGTIEEVCSVIRGNVYQEYCSDTDVTELYREDAVVTGLFRQMDSTYIRRFITKKMPQPEWIRAEPNLEDLYLYYFHEGSVF